MNEFNGRNQAMEHTTEFMASCDRGLPLVVGGQGRSGRDVLESALIVIIAAIVGFGLGAGAWLIWMWGGK